jgi:8-amino-7-oxononanoate synthase
LRLIREGDERRSHLASLIAAFRGRSQGLPWRALPSQTPIQPLLIGEAGTAAAIAEALAERGLLVPAIRPPTVPAGTARLRISLSAAHTAADVDRLVDALHEVAHG